MLLGALHFAQNGDAMLVETLCRCGRPGAAGMALEQLDRQGLFQISQLQTEARLGAVQARGRAIDAAFLINRNKRTNMTQIQGFTTV